MNRISPLALFLGALVAISLAWATQNAMARRHLAQLRTFAEFLAANEPSRASCLVAEVDGKPEIADAIAGEFREAGLAFGIHGSLGYAVEVPQFEERRALALLCPLTRRHPDWFYWLKGDDTYRNGNGMRP